jgi:hypothetical protein
MTCDTPRRVQGLTFRIRSASLRDCGEKTVMIHKARLA